MSVTSCPIEGQIKIEIGDPAYASYLLGTGAGNIYTALWQFPDNAIFAGANQIYIELKPDSQLIVISDNGEGMDRAFILELPKRICDSIKRKLDSAAKGHGTGILNYQSFANQCIIYSRSMHSNETWAVEFTPKSDTVRFWQETGSQALKQQGTKVCLFGVSEDHFRTLTPKKLDKYYGSKVEVALREGTFSLWVIQGREKILVSPQKRLGVPFKIEPIPMHRGPVKFELSIVPQGTKGRVAITDGEKDILDDITRIPEFNCPPWNQGAIRGRIWCYADQDHAREKFIRNDNLFSWIKVVKTQEALIADRLEDVLHQRKSRVDLKLYNIINNALNEALFKLDEFNAKLLEKTKGGKGRIKGDIDVPDLETKKPQGRKGKKLKKGKVKPNPESKTQPVRSRLILTFDEVTPWDDELNKRSNFDPIQKRIHVNIEHPDYKIECAEDGATNLHRRFQYLVKLAAKHIAFYNNPGISPEDLIDIMIGVELETTRVATLEL